MRKKKKAFTLIELLAIIVILAIIAVITVPIILNIIDNSSEGASKDSAYGYIDAVNKYYLTKLVNDTSQELPTGIIDVSELPEDFSVSGTTPSEGWIKLEKGQVLDYSLKFGDYIVNYDEDTKSPIASKGNEVEALESDSSWFTYTANDNNTIKITGFSDKWDGTTDIVIPSKIDGLDVEVIGSGAFYNTEITSLKIGNKVKSIQDGAFINSKINELDLGSSVETIGQQVFSNTLIVNLKIPNSVTTIEFATFQNCKNLEKVIIGNGLETVRADEFSGSPIKELIIGSSVKTIEANAFKNTQITDLVIPDNVETIGSHAFSSTNSILSTITIGSNVTSIGTRAFSSENSNSDKLTVYNKSSLTLTNTDYFSNRTNIEFK